MKVNPLLMEFMAFGSNLMRSLGVIKKDLFIPELQL